MSLSSATRECAYLTTKISCLIRLNWTKLHVFCHSLANEQVCWPLHYCILVLVIFVSSHFLSCGVVVNGTWIQNPDTLSAWTFKIMFHRLKNTTYFWMLFFFFFWFGPGSTEPRICVQKGRKATLTSSSVVFLSLCFFFCRWY